MLTFRTTVPTLLALLLLSYNAPTIRDCYRLQFRLGSGAAKEHGLRPNTPPEEPLPPPYSEPPFPAQSPMGTASLLRGKTRKERKRDRLLEGPTLATRLRNYASRAYYHLRQDFYLWSQPLRIALGYGGYVDTVFKPSHANYGYFANIDIDNQTRRMINPDNATNRQQRNAKKQQFRRLRKEVANQHGYDRPTLHHYRYVPKFDITVGSLFISLTMGTICYMMQGSNRVTMGPEWDPAGRVPFQQWIRLVQVWLNATSGNMGPAQQAAAIQLGLRGMAQEFALTIPPSTINQGALIEGIHVDGVTYLLYQLAQRFEALEDERSMQTSTALLDFRGRAGERMDALLTRFDLVRHQARQVNADIPNFH